MNGVATRKTTIRTVNVVRTPNSKSVFSVITNAADVKKESSSYTVITQIDEAQAFGRGHTQMFQSRTEFSMPVFREAKRIGVDSLLV